MSNTPENQEQKTPEGALSNREALIALQDVYIETEALFHQSSMFIERLHGQGELSMGRRSMLLTLFYGKLQTVPQLARAKSVSRQYIQKLVNQLAREGYVEFSENVAHKRSPFVRLTEEGRTYLMTMLQHEMKIVAAMVIDIPAEKLRETVQILRAVREWQKAELERLLHVQAEQEDG